ncbi:MAG: hypothetical protein V7K41_32015 [Nostoc sp.]|uniref:hypothetical protein n=1 Tax=Nostoc sp. TaxID=1180 RepID=UPI002FFA262F
MLLKSNQSFTRLISSSPPLRVIQEISGHRNLEQLQKYLEVTDEQVLGAAAALAMLSLVSGDVGKYNISSKRLETRIFSGVLAEVDTRYICALLQLIVF